MVETSGSGDITGNMVFRLTFHELTSLSRKLLNQFEQSWARLKAIMWPWIKCKWIMTATASSGGIVEKMTYMPN